MIHDPFGKLGDLLFAATPALPLTPSNPAIHLAKSNDQGHNGPQNSWHQHPSGAWVRLDWSAVPTAAQLAQASAIVTGYTLLTPTTQIRELAKAMMGGHEAADVMQRALWIASMQSPPPKNWADLVVAAGAVIGSGAAD